MGVASYEFFDHAADVGIRVRAPTLPGLFCTAAQALMEWMGAPPDSPAAYRQEVALEAQDREELLVGWLQELLFLFHSRHAYFMDASRLEISGGKLEATVTARIWDDSTAHGYQEVKAVTYHKLEVSHRADEWQCSVILDI